MASDAAFCCIPCDFVRMGRQLHDPRPGVASAVFALATIALGADKTLGAWKLDTAKSKQAAGVSPITSLTITREAAEDGVKVTVKGERADGSKVDSTSVAKYDGTEAGVTGTAWDTVSVRQVNANTVIEDRSKKGETFHATARIRSFEGR